MDQVVQYIDRKQNSDNVVGIYINDKFYPCLDWDKVEFSDDKIKLSFTGDGLDMEDSFGLLPSLKLDPDNGNSQNSYILNVNNGFNVNVNVITCNICWGCPVYGPYRAFDDCYIEFILLEKFKYKHTIKYM